MKIELLHSGIDVLAIKAELDAAPEIWNLHPHRRVAYGTDFVQGPHADISDVWIRYNDISNMKGDMAAFNDVHESVWYPEINKLPSVYRTVFDVMRFVCGERLGCVLITKIPAGKQCKPHIDQGWHSRYYDKFAVQIAGNDKQAFCFEGESLVTKPGDLYTFDNSFLHWVTNDSDEDRITLIICIKNLFTKEIPSCR
jgi:hypothetical protein